MAKRRWLSRHNDGRHFTVGGKKELPKITAPKRIVFTYGTAKKVERAIQEYLDFMFEEFKQNKPTVKLVGGTNVRGYSYSDIDFVLDSGEELRNVGFDDDRLINTVREALLEKRITLPHGIRDMQIDLFPAYTGEKDEVEWLSRFSDNTLLSPDQGIFEKKLKEYRRIGKRPEQLKRWHGRRAIHEETKK